MQSLANAAFFYLQQSELAMGGRLRPASPAACGFHRPAPARRKTALRIDFKGGCGGDYLQGGVEGVFNMVHLVALPLQ